MKQEDFAEDMRNGSFFDPGNPQSGNSSSSLDDRGTTKLETDYIKIGVLSGIIFFTIVGNASVVISILLRRAKMTRMYFFILHLSIADILTAFFTLLSEVIWTFTFPYFYGGNVVCKAVKYGQVVGPYLSSYTLVMTAVDRYQAICFPLANYQWSTGRSHLMLALAWGISLVFSIPQVSVYHHRPLALGECVPYWHFPWGPKAYVTWFAASQFFFPFLLLVFCYGNMCRTIYSNVRQKKRSPPQPPVQEIPDQDVARNFYLATSTVIVTKKTVKHWKHRTMAHKENANGSTGSLSQFRETVVEKSTSRSCDRIDIAHEVEQVERKVPTVIVNDDATDSRRSGRERSKPRCLSPSLSRSTITRIPSQKLRCHTKAGTKSISTAKIKTIKLTVAVVVGYLICSAPFLVAWLYAVWGKPGPQILSSLNWLFWLFTLNSCLNPWIYMAFNPELVRILFCRGRNDSGPLSAGNEKSTAIGSRRLHRAMTSTSMDCRRSNRSLFPTTTTSGYAATSFAGSSEEIHSIRGSSFRRSFKSKQRSREGERPEEAEEEMMPTLK